MFRLSIIQNGWSYPEINTISFEVIMKELDIERIYKRIKKQ